MELFILTLVQPLGLSIVPQLDNAESQTLHPSNFFFWPFPFKPFLCLARGVINTNTSHLLPRSYCV